VKEKITPITKPVLVYTMSFQISPIVADLTGLLDPAGALKK